MVGVLLLVSGCAAPTQPAARPLTYVAMGASDAVGIGAADPATQGWVPRLSAELGPNTRMVNLGVSGSTLKQALAEQLGPAVDARPDVVTVWLVVSDMNARVSVTDYGSQLDALLEGLQPTGAHILVGNVPDLAAIAAYSGANRERLDAQVTQWNAVIADSVARHHAQLVDLHSVWREIVDHPEYISADGFHPSSEGYAHLADIFDEAYAAGR